jgi:hypothetical protein
MLVGGIRIKMVREEKQAKGFNIYQKNIIIKGSFLMERKMGQEL